LSSSIFGLIFYGYMIFLIVKVVLGSVKVTRDTISAALITYLFIGTFFSRLIEPLKSFTRDRFQLMKTGYLRASSGCFISVLSP